MTFVVARAQPLAVLLEVQVRGRLAVDEDRAGRAAIRAAVRADSHT